MRRILGFLLRPLSGLLFHLASVSDPWERFERVRVPVRAFGPGSRNDFGWYFEGRSRVDAQSLEDVHEWLSSCCRYVPDEELFHEQDFWQHPCTFERTRCGDCEDYALWAWRRLVELGHDADFVVGRTSSEPVTGEVLARYRRHAWVMIRTDGRTVIYEPTRADGLSAALQPFELVRDRYVPELGVGPRRRSFAFGGHLLSAREKELRPSS